MVEAFIRRGVFLVEHCFLSVSVRVTDSLGTILSASQKRGDWLCRVSQHSTELRRDGRALRQWMVLRQTETAK